MIEVQSDRFRGEFELPLRATPEAALRDRNRLHEVLEEHAPELLGKKVGRVVPGGSPLADITVRTP